MKTYSILLVTALAAASYVTPSEAGGPRARAARNAAYHASARPWHGDYAYTPVGEPVALVLPPHADTITAWSWGVAQSEMRPLYHQFGRANPGGAMGYSEANPFLPTPIWPSHTDQFGVYPVRGPYR